MLKDLFTNVKHVVFSLLFPENCRGCGKADVLLCEECLALVPENHENPYKNVWSIFPYENRLIRKSIQDLKFKNRKEFAAPLGAALYEYLIDLLADENLFSGNCGKVTWLIVPVPLSKERLKTRGYNQAGLIGQSIVDKDKSDIFIMDNSVLYKRHETVSQVEIKDRKRRLENLKGLFAVRNAQLIHKAHIIVLDDVVTTGATMREAMKTLRSAGARKVIGLSVAH
ncbi:MAG: ComF family protein [Candidatus Vogelbacteria bacterium]|nr:ComF family protein [Candidatus Vogelbacteria bacterium]